MKRLNQSDNINKSLKNHVMGNIWAMSTKNSSWGLVIEQCWITLFAIYASLKVSSNLSSNIPSITSGQSSYCLLSLSAQWNNIGSYEVHRKSLAGMLDVLKCLQSQAFDMKRICHRELIWAECIVQLV